MTGSELDIPIEVLRRPYQRRLSVTVKPSGRILVTASKSTPQAAIHSFLDRHRNWLLKAVERSQGLRRKYPKAQYLLGEGFLFRGQWLNLDFVSSVTHGKMEVVATDTSLLVQIPNAQWSPLVLMMPQSQVAGAISKFYEQEGRKVLAERVMIWQARTGLRPSSVEFRNQKTRWGSCSSDGKISLNWRLIGAPPEVLDYVVVHELCHLRHGNHSRSFWNLVGTHLPDFRQRQRWLKDHQFALDFLNRTSELYSYRPETWI